MIGEHPGRGSAVRRGERDGRPQSCVIEIEGGDADIVGRHAGGLAPGCGAADIVGRHAGGLAPGCGAA